MFIICFLIIFPAVMVGRMVNTVSKYERVPEWMCTTSEKAGQALVVSFTTD